MTLIDQQALWLTLSRTNGLGGLTCKRLLDVFESPQAILQAPWMDLCERGGLSEKAARAISSDLRGTDHRMLQDEIERAHSDGARLVVYSDPDYPPLLKEIPDPPPCFYLKGALHPSDALAIAAVGTRRPTAYGRYATESLCKGLSSYGFTVVSGMARGIDGIAHRATLDAGGRTIAILGNGIHRIYPPEHRDLMKLITQQGAILSELPPDAPPDRTHFPRRNRLISGVTLGTLVVEAAARSGSLITARLALEQGREVFAVPGAISSPMSRGTHALIKQGAKLVEGIEDIVEEFPLQLTIPGKRGITKNSTRGCVTLGVDGAPNITEDERRLLACLTTDVPRHPDDIVRVGHWPLQTLSVLLLTLEMKGIIRQDAGRYAIRHEFSGTNDPGRT